MSALRLLARPAMAAFFVTGGIDAIRRPKEHAAQAEAVAVPIARKLGLPEDPVRLVRINGAVHVVAGTMLAFGRFPRLASAALTASMVPTTLAAHRFWEEEDPAARAQQRTQFIKNVAMTGGLILGVADTGGRPSVTWFARRAARRAAAATTAATTGAAGALAGVVGAAETSAAGALDSVSGILSHARGSGGSAAASTIADATSTLGDSAAHAARSARTAAEAAAGITARAARSAAARTVDAAEVVREVAGDAVGPTRDAAAAAVRSTEKVFARVPDHLRTH